MGNIYFYYGDERLIIRNKISRLISELKIDDLNLKTYDLDEVGLATVFQDAQTMPFLTDRKAIIVKNPRFLASDGTISEQDLKSLDSYIANEPEYTVLIFDASSIKIDERKAIVKKFKGLKNAIETKELSDVEILGWIQRQCTINGVNITSDAIKTFANQVGKDLTNSKNEIDKLIAYVDVGGTITSDIVNKVIVKEIQKDVYQLSNAIIDQDKTKIVNIYRDLITGGVDTYYLFSLVAKTIRDIYIVAKLIEAGYKQSEIASTLKVSPGRAYYMMRNSKSLKLDLVEEYIKKLGNLDYQVKSGQVDVQAGFELFLFAL